MQLLDLMEQWKTSHAAVYDFVADDEIGHRVWVIDGNEEIETIREQFENIPSIYIADGHHTHLHDGYGPAPYLLW